MTEVSETDIAVIGQAGRFPGARNVAEFWHNLRAGVESVQFFSEQELLQAGVEPSLLNKPNYIRASATLSEVSGFDPAFFGISAKDAAIMDPQHRHFLECCWEAIEDAGYDPDRFDGSIGVFAGCGMNSYFMHNLLTNPQLVESVGMFLLRHTSNDKDFLSTYVSYQMGLTGPSISIQTACSTSLVSIHVACQNLLNGECDMALAGGVTINIPHVRGYLHQEGEILASDGHCRAFDARADGTVFGSGTGVVVLRRLADAIANGDSIRAVIKGSAINNDGSMKAGYLAPSVDGQAHAIAEALAIAGVDADSISYVEAHGTGTAVGDPIEIEALTQAFSESTDRKGYCAIASNKPNIGHLDTAAGVASFIKVVESLRHEEIAPSLHYQSPNPSIDFDASPFQVNAELRSWPRTSEPRRAGVNSLGVGGTNAHVILEEAPESDPPSASRGLQLLLFSAKTPSALDSMAGRLADALTDADRQLDLADVAYTLKVGRKVFENRRAVLCRDSNEAAKLLQKADPKRVFNASKKDAEAALAFMFPGGGAQYPQMGRDLYDTESVFRKQVDLGLNCLAKHLDFDVRGILFAQDKDEETVLQDFERPSIQLPTIFIIEMALARLWMSWGLEPEALIGHSMGENTAACLAGVLSFEDALGLVALRGKLFEKVPEGGMASVALPAEELEPLLGPDLALGVINGPGLCVASGPVKALDRLVKELEQRDVEHHHVKISIAAHSPMLDPILEEFGDYLRSIELKPPEIPIVSNLTGTWLKPEEATDPDYWVKHLRSTIRFADGIGTLLENPGRVLLEVGPGRILSSISRQHPLARPGLAALSSIRHPEQEIDDVEFLLGVLGRLWNEGVQIDWDGFYTEQTRSRVPLPTYPFEHKSYWIEPGRPQITETVTETSLAKISCIDDWFAQPTWRSAGLPPVAPSERMRWLIFLDRGGLGSELKRQLEANGEEVITVREGDAFYRFGPSEYALAPEAGRDGYDNLIKDLASGDRLPQQIIHLWTVSGASKARPGSSLFHHHQERGFYSLFFLAQAIGDEGISAQIEIAVLSDGMQKVGKEPLLHPDKATLLGPVQVIPRELHNLKAKSIDVTLPTQKGRTRNDAETPYDQLASTVLLEIRSADHEQNIVAWRGDDRFVRVYEPAPSPSSTSEEPVLREGGVYLITGGLGGIGLEVARHFAAKEKLRLVLVGRTALPPLDHWDDWLSEHAPSDPSSRRILQVRALEAEGTEVMVADGDVANLERMQEILDQAKRRFGSINGVVHAAGTLEDGIIQMKSPEAVERVFTPKVHGSMVLVDLLEGEPLDFMLMFSSTSTILGPAGQVDYVAANTFLNAFAESRAGQTGVPVTAVNWGVWQEVGMARDLSRRMHDDRKLDGIHLVVRHPLLFERITDIDGNSTAKGSLCANDCWLLDEHRLRDGLAVLPGTGYLELIRAAYLEHSGQDTCEIVNLNFLAPLEVQGEEVREIAVELRASGSAFEVEVWSRDSSQTGHWQQQARCSVKNLGAVRPAPLRLDEIHARCTLDRRAATDAALKTPQDRFLAFGPRWQSLRSVAFGPNEALAALELPEQFASDLDDYTLHPALMDIATGYAMQLIEGYEEGGSLYVPMSYGCVRIHAPLATKIYAHVRLQPNKGAGNETANFDITIADETGTVLIEVEAFTIRKLAQAASFGANSSRTNPGPDREESSPAERSFFEALESGINVDEGMQALDRILAGGTPPVVIVSSISLDALRERQDQAAAAVEETPGVTFARPQLASEYQRPRDEFERQLADWWQELLGIDQVGIEDDFFELGGHSLIAVRLFAKIKKKWDIEYPLSVLFEAPTIALCADLLREELGDTVAEGDDRPMRLGRKHTYLVPMNDIRKTGKTPFFLVSGMFGNVLNLRHLSSHLGEDRPVYAIQARGLYGEEEPHRRFDEMASAYLEEVRKIQPEGPYLLGGFSGGGITAFEMAHQLLAVGEEVAALVLLDAPVTEVPTASWPDRLLIQWQRLWRQGPTYPFIWAKKRIAWEFEKRRRRSTRSPVEVTPAEFRSEQIEAAFIEALANYTMRPYPGRISLFRPPLPSTHRLTGNRQANSNREIQDHANHWGPYALGGIDVQEVPGSHDSMVLEPQVRVLGAKVRSCLERAQEGTQG